MPGGKLANAVIWADAACERRGEKWELRSKSLQGIVEPRAQREPWLIPQQGPSSSGGRNVQPDKRMLKTITRPNRSSVIERRGS
jgi:hypothetical protein